MAIFTHQFQLLWTECDYPKGFMIWIGLHGIMFLFLFSDFYKQSYIDRRDKIRNYKKESENGKVYLNGDSKLPNSLVSFLLIGLVIYFIISVVPILKSSQEEQQQHLNGGVYLNGHIEKNGQITNGITTNGSIRSRK